MFLGRLEAAHEVLGHAIDLISDPDKWTTGAIARKEDGTRCLPISPKAVRWCAYGALKHEHGVLFERGEKQDWLILSDILSVRIPMMPSYERYKDKIWGIPIPTVGGSPMPSYFIMYVNDNADHEEVIEMLKELKDVLKVHISAERALEHAEVTV